MIREKIRITMLKLRWFIYIATIACLLFVMISNKHSLPSKEYHLKMNISRDPATLDPRRGSELIGSTMNFLLHEGLMRLNPDGTLTPAQAESVQISDDRKTYTFNLRNTFWSDGTKVVASDFECAWKKILSPKFPAPNCHLLYPIQNAEKAKKGETSLDSVGIHSINDTTLVVELDKPTPYFLHLISFCVFFPVPHHLDTSHPDWIYGDPKYFVSNGPFNLASWKYNNEMILKKNNLYWEASCIQIEAINISIVSDENTALQMYESGSLDIIGMGYSPLPTEAIISYYQKGMLKTHPFPSTAVLFFNTHQFPMNNSNIRKAFGLAINRKEIVENITPLDEIALNITPLNLNKNQIANYFLDNNIQEAQRLFDLGLQELGVSIHQFPTLTYYYAHSNVNHKLAQAIQQQLEDVLEIKIHLQSCERKLLLNRLDTKNFEIAQTQYIAQYNDRMSILDRFSHKENSKNPCGWENSEYICLLEKSYYDLTEDEREKTLKAAEALILDEMPFIPIYHGRMAFMIKDHLTYDNLSPKGVFDISRIRFKNKNSNSNNRSLKQ